MEQIIGELPKNSTEIVRVIITEHKGHSLVDARVYFPDKNGEWHPTKKGLTLKAAAVKELLPLLQEALEKLAGVKV